jgi:hypothetical protein
VQYLFHKQEHNTENKSSQQDFKHKGKDATQGYIAILLLIRSCSCSHMALFSHQLLLYSTCSSSSHFINLSIGGSHVLIKDLFHRKDRESHSINLLD